MHVHLLEILRSHTLNITVSSPAIYVFSVCFHRKSDDYVAHAYRLLMAQLAEDHAEIRLSCYQVIDELFNRSHAFRELVVSEFQTFLELAVGKNSDDSF